MNFISLNFPGKGPDPPSTPPPSPRFTQVLWELIFLILVRLEYCLTSYLRTFNSHRDNWRHIWECLTDIETNRWPWFGSHGNLLVIEGLYLASACSNTVLTDTAVLKQSARIFLQKRVIEKKVPFREEYQDIFDKLTSTNILPLFLTIIDCSSYTYMTRQRIRLNGPSVGVRIYYTHSKLFLDPFLIFKFSNDNFNSSSLNK